jgi:hypothetical protein
VFTGIPVEAQPGGRTVSWGLRVLVAVGVVAIAVAWAQASQTVRVSEQVEWAPLGLAGVAAVSLALLGSVLVARQAVAIRLHRLTPSIAGSEDWDLTGTPAASTGSISGSGWASVASPTPAVAGSETLVAGAHMARYHRTSCPLAAGKPVRPDTRSAHEHAGRQACGVCAP